jgi:hypothetical protein
MSDVIISIPKRVNEKPKHRENAKQNPHQLIVLIKTKSTKHEIKNGKDDFIALSFSLNRCRF